MRTLPYESFQCLAQSEGWHLPEATQIKRRNYRLEELRAISLGKRPLKLQGITMTIEIKTSQNGVQPMADSNPPSNLDFNQKATNMLTNNEQLSKVPNDPSLPKKRKVSNLEDAAFHGLAGEIVRAIEPHTESDTAALLAQILVSFGIMVGRGPHHQVEGDEHHANLFCLIVGQTAKGRKGTSWGRVKQIFSQLPNWPRVVDGLSSGEGVKYNVRDAATTSLKKPNGKTADSVDDGVQDKRLLIVEAEFASVLKQDARATNTLSATIRSAWETGNLQTLTKNDPIIATGAHIGIIGHITDSELRRELSETHVANGYANRFLFVSAKRSKELPFGGDDLDPLIYKDFVKRITEAADAARLLKRIHMTQGARNTWASMYSELSSGKGGLLGAVIGRAEPQCIRLALLYALLDKSPVIDTVHLEAAFAFWKRCVESARYIFGDAIGDPLSDQLLERLRENIPTGLSRSEISRLFSNHKRAFRIDEALNTLAELGLVTCETIFTGGANAKIWSAK